MTVEWELPHDLSAARQARSKAAADLQSRGVPEVVADDIVLIASELAANAVRHGRPPVLLSLDYGSDSVRVLVSNHGSEGDPHVVDADEGSHHGRGLAMVTSLATDVGWSRRGDRIDVWADVDLRPPADQ